MGPTLLIVLLRYLLSDQNISIIAVWLNGDCAYGNH